MNTLRAFSHVRYVATQAFYQIPAALTKRAYSPPTVSFKNVCLFEDCNCKQEEIIKLFKKKPNILKAYSLKNCVQLNLVNKGLSLHFLDTHCKVSQTSKEILFMTQPPTTISYIDMYTFLEKKKNLTLSGESGKITGAESYWEDLSEHFTSNKDKEFFIYSFGGGQGYDAKSIEELLVSKELKVSGFKVIEINRLAYHLSEYKDQFVIEDGHTYLDTLPIKKENQINVFHLGNFLSVLRTNEAIKFLINLSSKMQPGDIVSVLLIRDEQFTGIKSLEKNEKTEKYGLSEYDQVVSGTKKFFRTAVSNPLIFNNFFKKYGVRIIAKNIDQNIDAGPRRMKMFFVKMSGSKFD